MNQVNNETAHVIVNPHRPIGTVKRRLFGSFIEHIGRAVYDGIYEPSHSTADGSGFREDVRELVRELGVSAIRYPGGNFVSGYRWEDGVGPRQDRPVRLDLAWHSTETNEVGLHEFSEWCESVGSELMLAANLGSRGIQEALDLLEYANVPAGTRLSDLRRANGAEDPFGVKMWCLGNEMDGQWQIGHTDADHYGRLAGQTARAMKLMDPTLELVACGSSNAQMPTFISWERTVLEHCYDDVDFISCHAYYDPQANDLATYLASAVDMDRFIEGVVATADHIGAEKRSDHRIDISFDEWNVWHMAEGSAVARASAVDDWPFAPRLFEQGYTVADGVVLGSLLISLLKHADRVTSASLAQLVNVISPITTEPGGDVWRQSTFFPFAITSRLANGTALALDIECGTYPTALYGDVKTVDGVAVQDAESCTVFLVHRGQEGPVTVSLDGIGELSGMRPVSAQVLSDPDVAAANTLDNQERVLPRDLQLVSEANGNWIVELPPVAWAAITFESVARVQ